MITYHVILNEEEVNMDYFLGNIDAGNINFLDEAAKKSNVEYIQRTYMTFGENNIKQFSFVPVFCENKETTIKLLRSYFQIAQEMNKDELFQNDSYMFSKQEIQRT